MENCKELHFIALGEGGKTLACAPSILPLQIVLCFCNLFEPITLT